MPEHVQHLFMAHYSFQILLEYHRWMASPRGLISQWRTIDRWWSRDHVRSSALINVEIQSDRKYSVKRHIVHLFIDEHIDKQGIRLRASLSRTRRSFSQPMYNNVEWWTLERRSLESDELLFVLFVDPTDFECLISCIDFSSFEWIFLIDVSITRSGNASTNTVDQIEFDRLFLCLHWLVSFQRDRWR